MPLPTDSCNRYVNGAYFLNHDMCAKIDMNMVCRNDIRRCRCREGMKWNEATLECQIYIVRQLIDIDCNANFNHFLGRGLFCDCLQLHCQTSDVIGERGALK